MREAKKREDRNQRRRELYASDPNYRAKVLQQQRQAYNKESRKSQLRKGVLQDGVRREMRVDGIDELIVLEGYTLREMGDALGKALLTIRSWVLENGIIPPPFCEEASTGYRQYTRFELDVIAEILAEHETHSRYVSTTNTELIEELWAAIEQVRAGFLMEDAQ